MNKKLQSTVSNRSDRFTAAVVGIGITVVILGPLLVQIVAGAAQVEWYSLPLYPFHSLSAAGSVLDAAAQLLLLFIVLELCFLSRRPISLLLFLGLVAAFFLIAILSHGNPPSPSALVGMAGMFLFLMWAISIAAFIEITLKKLSWLYYAGAAGALFVAFDFWFGIGCFNYYLS